LYAKKGRKVAPPWSPAGFFDWLWHETWMAVCLRQYRPGFHPIFTPPLRPFFSVVVNHCPMKLLLLSSLLALATVSAALAQSPATVKTKVKPVGQASVKTKTTAAASAPAAEAPAPPAATVDAKANALTANMQQNLGLSPQQTEKVRAINRRSVEGLESARLQYKTDPRKLAGVIETISSSRLSAIKDVLTPAQFAKYQRKREEKMGVPNVQGVQGTPPPGLGGGSGDQ
jgi:hypothetical protein